MTLSLVITDTGDGTGGTATISGSAGGSANTVYYTPFTGSMQQLSWLSAGTRSGDGGVSLPVGAGYFLFQLVSDALLGPVYYKSFVDLAIEAIHWRILVAAQARINQLALLATSRVLIKWIPRLMGPELPMLTSGPLIFIAPPGAEVDESVVLNQDDFGYPFLVAICYKQNADSVANLKQMLRWREKIMRAIRYQRLTGLIENLWVDPKPLAIVDPDEFTERNLLVSAMGFSVRVRQTRGLT